MDKNQMKQTKFDSMVTTPTMQLAKAVIPYIDNPVGKYLGMFIKFQELQNAARINNNVSIAAMNADKHRGMESMMEDIMDFMSDDTRETFENIKSMMEMMEAMNGMDMDEDTMNAFMGSAFGGDASPFNNNDNFTYNDNEDKDFDTNRNNSFAQDNEPRFNQNEDISCSQNNNSAYDNFDDVTSSPISNEKGFNDYE